MSKFAIRGLNDLGEKVFDYLTRKGHEIVAVSDANPQMIGGKWHGLNVVSPEELLQMAESKEYDSIFFALRNRWIKDVVESFKGREHLNGFMIPTHRSKFSERLEDDSFVRVDFTRPRLKQFDVNVVDHCNMKCKGCLRYSNLVDEPFFADYDRMIKDWERISELFWGVERVKIMGGEPMLSPDLCDYVCEARRLFPDADIMVTTNALLINDSCQRLYQTMIENGVFFDVSLYKPVEDNIERLLEVLDRSGVWYELNYSKGNFYKIRSATPDYDPDEMYESCQAKNCHHLREGKLSVCSAPQYAHYMNERFGVNMPTEDGVFDIYDDVDPWELDSKLSRSFESCRYCAPPVEFKWDRADSKTAQMSDWFVER